MSVTERVYKEAGTELQNGTACPFTKYYCAERWTLLRMSDTSIMLARHSPWCIKWQICTAHGVIQVAGKVWTIPGFTGPVGNNTFIAWLVSMKMQLHGTCHQLVTCYSNPQMSHVPWYPNSRHCHWTSIDMNCLFGRWALLSVPLHQVLPPKSWFVMIILPR